MSQNWLLFSGNDGVRFFLAIVVLLIASLAIVLIAARRRKRIRMQEESSVQALEALFRLTDSLASEAKPAL